MPNHHSSAYSVDVALSTLHPAKKRPTRHMRRVPDTSLLAIFFSLILKVILNNSYTRAQTHTLAYTLA